MPVVVDPKLDTSAAALERTRHIHQKKLKIDSQEN
jgi:hypothetical protein